MLLKYSWIIISSNMFSYGIWDWGEECGGVGGGGGGMTLYYEPGMYEYVIRGSSFPPLLGSWGDHSGKQAKGYGKEE